MGSLPAKRLSKSKVRRRRSQQFLTKIPLVPCKNCKGPAMQHRACMHCGYYAKRAKKTADTQVIEK